MPSFSYFYQAFQFGEEESLGRHILTRSVETQTSVLLFTSFLAIPLACQCCFDTTLLTRLQVVGMTLHFLDDVFLLYLALKPAQCVFKRFAFLQANLGQKGYTSKLARKAYPQSYGNDPAPFKSVKTLGNTVT